MEFIARAQLNLEKTRNTKFGGSFDVALMSRDTIYDKVKTELKVQKTVRT